MVSFVDAALGNVTQALRAANMWADTLLFVASDNGGPSLTDRDTSNNFPLRVRWVVVRDARVTNAHTHTHTHVCVC